MPELPLFYGKPIDTPTGHKWAADHISTIYVVNWVSEDVGGFDWFTDREPAAAHLLSLRDGTARLHVVAVPDELAEHPEAITSWLDDDGWSDGGDPRLY